MNNELIKRMKMVSDFPMFKFAKEAAEKFNRFTQTGKISAGILADHGWYVSDNMPLGLIFSNVEKILTKTPDSLDKEMVRFYKREKKNILNDLIIAFPKRKAILKEVFECHDKKNYFASTSLFLSQADGIFQGKLFKIKTNKASLKEHLKVTDFSDYLSEIITEIRPIDHPTQNKNNWDLNRHEVMHGLSYDYGTEINSYKAMSLLSFIVNRKK